MNRQQEKAIHDACGRPDADEIVDAVKAAFTPKELYGADALDEWATENGYVKAE